MKAETFFSAKISVSAVEFRPQFRFRQKTGCGTSLVKGSKIILTLHAEMGRTTFDDTFSSTGDKWQRHDELLR